MFLQAHNEHLVRATTIWLTPLMYCTFSDLRDNKDQGVWADVIHINLTPGANPFQVFWTQRRLTFKACIKWAKVVASGKLRLLMRAPHWKPWRKNRQNLSREVVQARHALFIAHFDLINYALAVWPIWHPRIWTTDVTRRTNTVALFAVLSWGRRTITLERQRFSSCVYVGANLL